MSSPQTFFDVKALDDAAAAKVIVSTVQGMSKARRKRFLRELLVHTAAMMMIDDGARYAAEQAFQLADAIVGKTKTD